MIRNSRTARNDGINNSEHVKHARNGDVIDKYHTHHTPRVSTPQVTQQADHYDQDTLRPPRNWIPAERHSFCPRQKSSPRRVMSPPSPSRAKRRRTTMTVGHSGDAAAGAPFCDQYVDASHIISTEPVKRKRLDIQQHVPTVLATPQTPASPYQPQQQPGATQAATPRLTPHHQQQQQPQQMMGMMTVYHRPTYRSDLAKRGYLVRNSLGCGSYSKVNW